MEFKFEYVIFAFVALVGCSIAYKVIKHGGFKAAMFGAGIKNTVGTVSGSGPKLVSMAIKVHELDGAPDKAIGLELVAKSVGSYEMKPVALSVSEARKLSELLSQVLSDR